MTEAGDSQSRSVEVVPVGGDGPRVLVVDDSEAQLLAYSRILTTRR